MRRTGETADGASGRACLDAAGASALSFFSAAASIPGCFAALGVSALGALAAGAESTSKVVGAVERRGTAASAGNGPAVSCGAGVAGVAAAGDLTAVGFSAARCGSCAGCSALVAGVAGGLTTTEPAGGATTTTGRVPAAEPAGGLATTVPAGGREAIAGVDAGVTTLGGACRAGGRILRGSGRAGDAASGVAAAAGGAAAAGLAGVGAEEARAGAWLCRASCSSFFLAARTAFSASPGLETWERSIFGVIVWEARDEAPPPWPVGLEPRPRCVRTFSASSSSSELEWVLPWARPSSVNMSRICRLLTSISRARSLIRTLLIRLFSIFASQSR